MNRSTTWASITFAIGLLVALSGCGQQLVQFGDEDTETPEDTSVDTSMMDTSPDTTADTGVDTSPDTTGDTGPTDADAGGDTTPPTVLFTVPRDGERAVSVSTDLTVRFDEAIDPNTIDDTTFTLEQNGNAVSGSTSVSGSGMEATFSPDSDLQTGTSYTATLTTGITDTSGNALAQDYTWSFDTEAPPVQPPVVVATNPADLGTGVSVSSVITVEFSQPMNGSTIDNQSFTVRTGGNRIAGTVTSTGTQATFTPSNPLQPQTSYTATLTTQIEGSSGMALPQQYSWSFETTTDTNIPAVTITRPLPQQTNVSTTRGIRVFFSEAMDPATVDSSSFLLEKANGTPVSGTVRLRTNGTRATFGPDAELDPQTTYVATVKSSMQDTEGDSLAADYTWSFSTGDQIRPAVVRLDPADGDSGVPVDTDITARFTKHIDASTLTTSTFSLTQSGTPVSGSVSVVRGRRARFSPASDLMPGTTYDATITTGITDQSGNALQSNSTWSFTTAP